MQQVAAVETFPAGSLVLHIGPPKTGTTAVQSALFLRQDDLARHGVAYPGRRRHERAAVSAAALGGAPGRFSGDIEKHWRRLTDEVAAATADRVVISSEIFALAPDARLPRIVEDLRGRDLRVVLTVRPPARMLPSQWQQSVQDLETLDYDTWLGRLFEAGDGPDPYTRSLWHQFRVDRLVRRWGAHVGEENVTVVVLDPAARSMLLHTFERLLGLPTDYLEPAADEQNLSLPYPEVEVLRAFNRRFREQGLDRGLYVQAVGRRAMRQIKRTGRSAMAPHPIVTPGWAVERANAVAVEMADAIRSSDARVVGDLGQLVTPVPDDQESAAPTTVSVESAGEIAYGVFVGGREQARAQAGRPARRPTTIDDLPAKDLARALVGRVARRFGRR